MTDPTELTLQDGRWAAVVSTYGASLRGVTCDGETVVTGYRGADAKQGGQGDVLIPFPGRVRNGRYEWDGVEHQLPLTDKDGPNAIHGFVRKMDWTLASRTASSAAFQLRFEGAAGYAFPLALGVEYSLHDTHGLQVTTTITNSGAAAAPVGVGFHPYFTVGSATIEADRLELPFAAVMEFESLLPTGRTIAVERAGLDFRTPRAVGTTRINHCFAAPVRGDDGRVVARVHGASRIVSVWMDEGFDYAVVYTGDALASGVARTSIAIEPMSCGTDALNHHEWGLTRLPSGETRVYRWGVSVAGA